MIAPPTASATASTPAGDLLLPELVVCGIFATFAGFCSPPCEQSRSSPHGRRSRWLVRSLQRRPSWWQYTYFQLLHTRYHFSRLNSIKFYLWFKSHLSCVTHVRDSSFPLSRPHSGLRFSTLPSIRHSIAQRRSSFKLSRRSSKHTRGLQTPATRFNASSSVTAVITAHCLVREDSQGRALGPLTQCTHKGQVTHEPLSAHRAHVSLSLSLLSSQLCLSHIA